MTSRRMARVFNLRPGEGRVVALAVATSFFASAGMMVGQSAAEALFFARYGVSRLPLMYLVLGGTMFLVSLGLAAVLARTAPGRAGLVIPLGLAVVAGAGRIALAAHVGWITQALWLLQGVAQFVVGWAVWGLAGVVADTRQAKRFFPLIGAGGVLGYVVGGLVTRPLAAWFGTANLILVWVGTLLVVVAIGTRLVARGRAEPAPPSRPRVGATDQLREGLRYVRGSSLLRWMALGSILFSLLFFSLYLPFSRAATARYPDPDELAGFFGLFFGVSTGVAFLLSLFATNRLLARFGVPAIMLVFPALYVAAFGVLTLRATFVILAVFRFLQVAWLSGGATSSWEAVINTVPPGRRDQTRAFLYGGPTQMGTILAGIVALVGEGAVSPRVLYAIGLAAAILATWAMLGARRAYPRALVQALREGRPSVFDAPASSVAPFGQVGADRSAAGVAIAALSDPDPQVRRVAAHLLGEVDSGDAREALTAAFDDEDADVRAIAVRSAARGLDDLPAVMLDRLRTLLGDDEPAVVAAAAGHLVRVAGDADATAALLALTRHHDEQIRSLAFRAMRDLRAQELAEAAIVAMRDDGPAVRREAARVLASLDDPERARDHLLANLADENREVRHAVAESLASMGESVVGPLVRSLDAADRADGALTALAYLPVGTAAEDLHRFAATAVAKAVERHRLGAAIDGGRDDRLGMLRDSVLARSERDAALGLRAASLLGGGADITVALDSLSVTDPAQRANALEVIESVGRHDLVRPLLSMWDGSATAGDPQAVLERLQHDPDDWIRACAAFAVEPRGGAMSETVQALSSMERVLFLRRVPLFASLAPPDLQPVAAIAEEQTFTDGEVIAEQGETGDAMFIIVDGSVGVVVRDERGERTVSVRSDGDVVGEMSVITHEPRIATLIARGSVRLLAIDRRRFEAILRERPETAIGVIHQLSLRLTEAQGRPADDQAGAVDEGTGTGTTTAPIS